MTWQEYTEDGLPVVSKETMESSLDIVSRSGIQDSMREVLGVGLDICERLNEENPYLCRMIYAIQSDAEKTFGPDYNRGLVTGAFLIYEALRRQASANQLEKEAGIT